MFRNIRIWWARRQLSPEQLGLLDQLIGKLAALQTEIKRATRDYHDSEDFFGSWCPEKDLLEIGSRLDQAVVDAVTEAMDACENSGIPDKLIGLTFAREGVCSAK